MKHRHYAITKLRSQRFIVPIGNTDRFRQLRFCWLLAPLAWDLIEVDNINRFKSLSLLHDDVQTLRQVFNANVWFARSKDGECTAVKHNSDIFSRPKII